jgi:arylsulfatase A-like enzyme
MLDAVVQALRQTSQFSNTVIIFTSDNGYMYGEHRLKGKGGIYEESIRVPLVMRGPGIPRGEIRTQLVNNLDVVATIVELAGAVPGHDLDGKSLLSIINDSAAPWRTALLVQGIWPANPPGRFFAVRTQNSVYAEHNSDTFGAEQEYYDLTTDRLQFWNRAGDAAYQTKVAQLRALLATLKTCAGESCWVTDDVEAAPLESHGIARATVYRGPPPALYGSRRDYDRQQMLDE